MRARKHADNAAKMRAYRANKRNAQSAQSSHTSVTFDEVFRTVPTEHSKGSDEYYTPRWVIDAARQVLGAIDLDPASCDTAQAVVCATRYYTQADNGLIQPWAGRVWCNPPYSDPLPWVKKLIHHYTVGEVRSALLLLNMDGSPEWANLLWGGGYPVCIFADRIQFKGKQNNKSQFIWYFGRYRGRFAEAFTRYGFIR